VFAALRAAVPYLLAYRLFVSLQLLTCSRALKMLICSNPDQIYEAADNRVGKRKEGMVDLENEHN